MSGTLYTESGLPSASLTGAGGEHTAAEVHSTLCALVSIEGMKFCSWWRVWVLCMWHGRQGGLCLKEGWVVLQIDVWGRFLQFGTGSLLRKLLALALS